MRHPAMLAAGLFAVATTNAHATTLSQSDLPTALSSCASTTCTVTLDSSYDTDFMSVFMVARMRLDDSAHDINWLVRYTLTAPSARTYVADPDFGTSSTTPYSGYLWLEASQTLDLSGQNLFTLYTDKVVPDPDVYDYGDDPSTWVFGMDSPAAIAGTAAYYHSGDDGYYDPVEYGNLAVIDGPLICIECGLDVQLNLIGLDYAATGTSTVNPADGRGLLLSHHSFYDSYSDTTQAFYVQAVPLPAAAWLFGWGLAAIGLVRKRGQTPFSGPCDLRGGFSTAKTAH
ncbi:MAG: VPLPA-CTERM sorting domain-containing protein [Xanthomonadaceae bacterium]|nr:VPLPA-CTERM sorting domain-containing protein [Xanthomonadaceae bacterium]